ncbi:hypothetical protein GUJ93_ZPchr0007g5574 [Zizania palustris]|uniref:Uncharacterized protein n=1 Tax=Zizania palustris TaxID=103762 RepID=A0A8J5SQI6_ZIZPA|nr:hypothetical protein GUJ93_ZPchr0007g5574 [Zizania palustris]
MLPHPWAVGHVVPAVVGFPGQPAATGPQYSGTWNRGEQLAPVVVLACSAARAPDRFDGSAAMCAAAPGYATMV